MNLRPLLPLLWWAAAPSTRGGGALLSGALASEAVPEPDADADDGYYDLESMSDEELEEVCTSRGFALVRENDPETGEPLAYAHRDYVDAASECLRIEADLEEILEEHPELLEDVREESERMMGERDRLLAELQEQVREQERRQRETTDGPEEERARDDAAGVGEGPSDPDAAAGPDARDRPDDAAAVGEVPTDPVAVTGSFQEITLEVIQQVKSDFSTVANFLLPKSLRERIRTGMTQTVLPAMEPFVSAARERATAAYEAALSEGVREKIKLQAKQTVLPAVKSFATVARGMGATAYGMARRYLSALWDAAAGGGGGVPEGGTTRDEGDARREETANAA